MPFVSDKQRRYLYANKPAVAKKFAKHERSSLKALKKHGKRKKSR